MVNFRDICPRDRGNKESETPVVPRKPTIPWTLDKLLLFHLYVDQGAEHTQHMKFEI
jgi:hypothetical protein